MGTAGQQAVNSLTVGLDSNSVEVKTQLHPISLKKE